MHNTRSVPITGIASVDEQLHAWLLACGSREHITAVSPCRGGSINNACLVKTSAGRTLFVKFSSDSRAQGAFATEAMALQKLREPAVLEVPEPLLWGESFLLSTAFREGEPAYNWQEQMGTSLALLHRDTAREGFGFECDNRLGFSLQTNTWCDDWIAFWREHRLLPQLTLLAELVGSGEGLLKLGYTLLEQLEEILLAPQEKSVLLHGDLWSGNASATETGHPVIFDPASYYGHREAEFGMMRLFGGFDSRCENAYEEVWSLAPGSDRRIAVYRLYHELNHLILFGRAYYNPAVSTLRSVL